MSKHAILQIQDLGYPWPTSDPFLLCAYLDDAYPNVDGHFGPAASLAGRDIGRDFAGKDGWNMYHGDKVPGFPAHPHRGFETVTLLRQGIADHSDSRGGTARFGAGDVQWLTTGQGIVHSEMFPLLDSKQANPLEMFQLWLNLPARSKMVDPHFQMMWAEDIPHRLFVNTLSDGNMATTEVVCIAGHLNIAPTAADGDNAVAAAALSPPPDSWASQPESDVAIWTLRMEPGARWTLPRAINPAAVRNLYFFEGASIAVGDKPIATHCAIELRASSHAELVNRGGDVAELLMLQGRAIGEPVAQSGPFVLNTEEELKQAFDDYQRSKFGAWFWSGRGPTHGPERERFARHSDGRVEFRNGEIAK